MKTSAKLSERLSIALDFKKRPRRKKRRCLLGPLANPEASAWDIVALLDSQCGESEVTAVRNCALEMSGQCLESGSDLPFLRVQLPPQAIPKLAQRDECVHLDLNHIDDIEVGPVDVAQEIAAQPCNRDVHRKVKDGAFRKLTGKGIRIGILDTGFTPHRLLPNKQVRSSSFTTESSAQDSYGHGTFIIGQWLSTHEEFSGLIPEAKVESGKILACDGSGQLAWILMGLDRMRKLKPDILNNSWGGPVEHKAITMAINTLIDDGVIVVASAGNSGNGDGSVSKIGWPARMERVICAGAIDKEDRLASFSSTGESSEGKPDCVSYGQGIQSLRAEGTAMGQVIDNDFVHASGTSFSAPVVAAELALILELFRSVGKTPPPAKEFRTFVREHCCRRIVSD